MLDFSAFATRNRMSAIRSRAGTCPLSGFLRLLPDDRLGFIQPLQLVADLSQQVFAPRNVGVGFDTQRRGAIHHTEHAAALLRLRDDHLCRVGRRAIDMADLRHRAHRSQHVDGKEPVAQEDQEGVAGADGQGVVACEGEARIAPGGAPSLLLFFGPSRRSLLRAAAALGVKEAEA
jgi:hypothetical protein